MALCFVVMGFGRKTDYSEVPRTLDLDATYQEIIKPAVLACGLDCVRADEVSHSGIIDKPMYEMLLRADLVIADISTANPNALYELGVRHALRPFSTIVIKEIDGKFHFDLNHLATLQYKHLGEDIGSREAKIKAKELEKLIRAVLANRDLDSPVFTFLQGLEGPTLSEAEFDVAVAAAKDVSDSLSQALEIARRAATLSDSALARDHFRRAYEIQRKARVDSATVGSPDPFIIQQLALHTYKADAKGTPEKRRAALEAALRIIEELSPDTSTDPETLGIAGAIHKRLYLETKERAHIDHAVELYGRGCVVKRDYYNGENYATCLDWRAQVGSAEDADYDRKTARRVRQGVAERLRVELSVQHVSDRSDYKWMLASMANTLTALGRDPEQYESAFRAMGPAQWELDTFEQGKTYAAEIATAQ